MVARRQKSGRISRASLETVKHPAVRDLVELGLTLGEARVYLALLDGPPMTAAEIAVRSEVARPKVYEALQLLVERGFCQSIASTSTTVFRPVPPARSVRELVRHRDEERLLAAERDASVAEQLIASLPEPDTTENLVDPFAYLEPIFGRTKTSQAFSDLIGRAKRSIDNMTQPPFLQSRKRWNLSELDALERGVSVRTLYTRPAIDDSERWVPLARAGGEARVTAEIPMKLIIRDGVEAMVALRDLATGEQGVGNIVIRHVDLVRALSLLFDQAWEQAKPLVPSD